MLKQYEDDGQLLQLIKKTPNKGMDILISKYSGLLICICEKRLSGNSRDIEEAFGKQ